VAYNPRNRVNAQISSGGLVQSIAYVACGTLRVYNIALPGELL